MLIHRFIRQALVASLLMVPGFAVQAWDSVVTGKISEMGSVGGSSGAPGNYDLRVYIANQPALCPGAPDASWAYINSNDANYKGLLAMLLMAQATGKTVTLYSKKGAGGYCQIGYMSVAG